MNIEVEEKKRRSGEAAYLHSHRVAKYIYKLGLTKEYVIAGLFHDVPEDTIFKANMIRTLLIENYVRKYNNAFDNGENTETIIERIIDAIKRLTKREGFAKCYNVLSLETTDGKNVAVENFWDEIKIYKIDNNGKKDPNLMTEEELKSLLSGEDKKKF